MVQQNINQEYEGCKDGGIYQFINFQFFDSQMYLPAILTLYTNLKLFRMVEYTGLGKFYERFLRDLPLRN